MDLPPNLNVKGLVLSGEEMKGREFEKFQKGVRKIDRAERVRPTMIKKKKDRTKEIATTLYTEKKE
jgi:hypothetical protein